MIATSDDEVPLRGRYTQLVPPPATFLDEMYMLAATNQIPWQWGGSETPTAFRESLWNRVLVAFAIQELRTGRCVGLLRADNANVFHGFAYVTMILHPEYRMRAWPLEASVLFGNYLFTKFDLRNLYAEVTADSLEQFRSGIGRGYEVEGHLRDRVRVNGRRQDLYILTFRRESLQSAVGEMLKRITRNRPTARP